MTTHPNPDDEQITALSDTLYDALYAITPLAEPHFADETEGLKNAVLAVLSETASQQWVQKQLDETGIRAMDFRNGMQMEMEPARELLAAWVAAARTMLGDAPNYTETKVSMDVKVAESPEMYTLVVQRHAPGALTPHEARQKAEARTEQLAATLREVLDEFGPMHDVYGGPVSYYDGSADIQPERYERWRSALGDVAPVPTEEPAS